MASHGTWPALSVGAAAGMGLCCAGLAVVLTTACYGMEDLFRKLPIHWAFWPPIGGVVVGLGGLIEPRALGVGYSQISSELAGRLALGTLALLLVMKLIMWSVALGSGTSGGILAPLLIMGAAMGGLLAPVLPGGDSGSWALLGMAGALAGVTRSPFTAVVFAFELTRNTGTLLPLLCTCAIAHLFSSLVLKRSILTEKVARKGFHVMREYAVDPLEALYVRDAMLTEVLTVNGAESVADLLATIRAEPSFRHQRLYPTLDGDGVVTGGVGFSDLLEAAADASSATKVASLVRHELVLAYADETLRHAADRMAENWLGALPVVERDAPHHLVGMLTEFDLLKARQRQLVEERHRERVLRLRRPTFGGRNASWRSRFDRRLVGLEVVASEVGDTPLADREPPAG
jgi:CBS domain-containing protein